jgi:hypothetical protein
MIIFEALAAVAGMYSAAAGHDSVHDNWTIYDYLEDGGDDTYESYDDWLDGGEPLDNSDEDD